MKQILLCYSADTVKAFRQAVGVIFHNPFHPNVNGECVVKAEAEKKRKVCNLNAYSVNV